MFFERGGYTMCAVYHPAALLRIRRRKEDMYRDMKTIAERITIAENTPQNTKNQPVSKK